MTPMQRAEALHKHATNSGEPLEHFVLELSDIEAFQMLDWLATAGNVNRELLQLDLAAAKAAGNPWPVMNCFLVMGMQVVRRLESLH